MIEYKEKILKRMIIILLCAIIAGIWEMMRNVLIIEKSSHGKSDNDEDDVDHW
jgi:hypothetical protein